LRPQGQAAAVAWKLLFFDGDIRAPITRLKPCRNAADVLYRMPILIQEVRNAKGVDR
jgi:hypothetical protein